MKNTTALALILYLTIPLAGCPKDDSEALVTYTEEREVCAGRNPQRNLYFGDLHAHTGLSFDAWAYGNHYTPSDLYRFAQGEELVLQPGDRPAQLDRPLDFAAVSDHHEYLGEIELCVTEGSPVYNSDTCTRYRDGDVGNVVNFGMQLALTEPDRFEDVCDPEQVSCLEVAGEVWGRIQDAAEAAYDRSSACTFTSFVAYEYTNAASITNLHRNVIFRNQFVPYLPPSYFEQTRVWDLWRDLDQNCNQSDTGCEVIVVPHNSNWSNGQQFYPDYDDARGVASQREAARFRARMEPMVEMFQHKGDMECENNLADPGRENDPLCDFEKQRHPPFDDCGEEPGAGGVSLLGCIHRYEFVRNVMKLGLKEWDRLGQNPYQMGWIGSTDTHNSTPGLVSEDDFLGHVGSTDDTATKRLGPGNMTHHGVLYNGGGLAAVWAVENSRDALFEAFRRREVYATSGPRMAVRVFGGWDFDANLFGPDWLSKAYRQGVPMGGIIPSSTKNGSLSLAIDAQQDPQSLPLVQVQVIKGWLDASGQVREKVFSVWDQSQSASVDLTSCETQNQDTIFEPQVWTDPEFDPALPAFYYVRVLEAPRCRWSVLQCNALASDDRPESCSDPNFYRAIQERAWTSPIWYYPN